MDADKLLAIALREMKTTQEEFRTLAGRLDGGDPLLPGKKRNTIIRRRGRWRRPRRLSSRS